MIQIGKKDVSRRQFLSGCVGAAGCSLCPGVCAAAPEARTRLRLVFAHPDPKIQGWPYQGYDYEGRAAAIASRLRAAFPAVEFLAASSGTAQEARAVLESDPGTGGYVVFLLGIPSDAQVYAFSKRPTVLVDDLYGGTGQFLRVHADARRQGMPVTGVASSDFADVVRAVKALECTCKLRGSVLLDVLDRDLGAGGKAVRENIGPEVRGVRAEELNEAYAAADRGEARKWAKAWIEGAAKVIEPTAEEIGKSGAMYVAMRGLMERQKAQGIAVDCLRLFYGGRMPAYPCLGFFQLNNDGLVGACEADLQSAATMLAIAYLTGRPGFISDPVIDSSKNRIVYAHCVAPNRMFGPDGASNPYHIRSHSEDRKGAAVRSLMPLDQMTTTLKLVPESKTMVLHQARAVANIDDDRACRTKLAAEIRDPRKMLLDWDYGWHRVTVYGDHKKAMLALADLLGFKTVEEG